jgi:electron transfer flavoprotein beta subunit
VSGPGPGSLESVELGLGLGEVAVFGLGVGDVTRLLRRCLAMGAAAVAAAPEVHAVAEALRGAHFDLVLVPQRSGDQGPSPVGPLLAGLLGLPQATAVESLRLEDGEVVVVRRRDHGEREELALTLPAVVAVEPGIVRPRESSPAALVTAQTAEVPALPSRTASRPVLLGHLAPRPPAPRLTAPDASLPAEARIAAVIGATTDGRQREIIRGSAEEVAERIVRLLEERGYV